MKTKEFLNGNLVIGKWLYNFLYTVLCVVVWLGMQLFSSYGLTKLNEVELIEELPLLILIYWFAQGWFIGYKLFKTNNYI